MIYSAHSNSNRATKQSLSLRIHRPTRLINEDLLADDVSANLFDAEQFDAGQFETEQLDTDRFDAEHLDAEQFDPALAERILQRIESRLPGRVQNLTVYTTTNAVVLAGQCSTFYSKQLAQHVAMGVLEYESLINNIKVRVAK